MLNRMSNHAWVCKICSRDHPTKQCPEIKDVSTPRKQQKCQSRGLCIRCLEDQHVGNCRNQNILCRKCLSRDHFTVMHSRIYDASDSSMETESSEEEEEKKCIICSQAHPISNCYQFLSTPVEERIMLCKARGICQVCLSKEHQGTCGPPIPNCKICHSIGHSVYLHDAPGGRELCLLCPPGSRHLLEHCTSFLCMAIDARNHVVETYGYCRKCLQAVHPNRTECQSALEGSTVGCHTCRSWEHHTLLHENVTAQQVPRNKHNQTVDQSKKAVERIRTENFIRVVVPATPSKTGREKLIIRYNKIHPKNLQKALNEATENVRGAEGKNLPLKKRPPLALGGITRKESPANGANGVSPSKGQSCSTTSSMEKQTQTEVEKRKPGDKGECVLCQEPKHKLDICHNFVTVGVAERERFVSQLSACCICLSVDHTSINCNSPVKECLYHDCVLSHHVLLHRRKYWKDLDREINEENHQKARKETEEKQCSICDSKNHLTEYCPCWPLGRQDRKPFVRYHGLCETCFSKKHVTKICPSREAVCGVNECPENHHPILHPEHMFDLPSPNRPLYENRVNRNEAGRFRLQRNVNLEQARQLIEEKWAGRTALQPPLQDAPVWYEQTRGQRNEVIVTHADFLTLYGAYDNISQQAAELAVEVMALAMSGLSGTQRGLLRLGSENNPLMNKALERMPPAPPTPDRSGDNAGGAGRQLSNSAPTPGTSATRAPRADNIVVHVQPNAVVPQNNVQNNVPEKGQKNKQNVVDQEATTEEEDNAANYKPGPKSKKRLRKNPYPKKQ